MTLPQFKQISTGILFIHLFIFCEWEVLFYNILKKIKINWIKYSKYCTISMVKYNKYSK